MKLIYVTSSCLALAFLTAYLTHAYDIHHDLCGHFNLMLNGLWEDLPVTQPKIEPEE